MRYDVCVVGLGGIGSAIAAHCAKRGQRVIGLEQFARGHHLGASSGRTRMIRQAYFEDPAYVPLVLRAYELWHELERESGEELLRQTGVITVGADTSTIVAGTARAAREHDLAIETLSRDEFRRRYPMLQLQHGETALFERDAGVLNPERATAAHLAMAERHGSQLRFETPVRDWEIRGRGFEIVTDDDSRITARALVLAMGPWIQPAMRELGVEIRVQRNVQAWFAPSTNEYDASRFPAFLVDRPELPAPLYGFPDFGDGVKAAFHGAGEMTTPDQLDRAIEKARDVQPLAQALEAWMPNASARFLDAKACMYSLTPDEHFVVDRHPRHERLIICGGFSGHGFKFAPVIGEIAADLVVAAATRHDIRLLSLGRFGHV